MFYRRGGARAGAEGANEVNGIASPPKIPAPGSARNLGSASGAAVAKEVSESCSGTFFVFDSDFAETAGVGVRTLQRQSLSTRSDRRSGDLAAESAGSCDVPWQEDDGASTFSGWCEQAHAATAETQSPSTTKTTVNEYLTRLRVTLL